MRGTVNVEFSSTRKERILLVNSHPYMPQLYGGAQLSTSDLVSLFQSSGTMSAVTAGLTKKGIIGVSSRIKIKAGLLAAKDNVLGYPVYRGWEPLACLDKALRDFQPTSAIVMSMSGAPLARRLTSVGIPTAFYFHNLEAESFEDGPEQLRVNFIANSSFTASRLNTLIGIMPRVIPPIYKSNRYVADRSSADSVLYVNPDRRKGFDTVLAVAAACPDIPFIIVEAWWSSKANRKQLRLEIAGLSNVTLQPSIADMKSLYSKTRVLLVPSIWEEAWGRVASEAQMSGIPVLASRMGGLVESVGKGGRLIEPASPAEVWVGELRRLWDSPELYSDLSIKALSNASRIELSSGWQLAQFDASLASARNKLSEA